MVAGRVLSRVVLVLTFALPAGETWAQKKAWPGRDFMVKREEAIDSSTDDLAAIEALLEEEAESAATIFQSRSFERPRLIPRDIPRDRDLPDHRAGTELPYELWLEPTLGSTVAGALALYSHDACAAIKAMRDEGHIRVGLDELKGRSRQHVHYTLAHELNHAIQFNSTFTKDCHPTAWLTEATANGAGLTSAYIDNGQKPLEAKLLTLNTRSFGEAFRPSDSASGEAALARLGYGTGAFFHWLGLRYDGPGYLKDLYERPLGESDDMAMAETRWIDRGLTEAPRVRTGLEFLFPQFVADYGSWGGTRLKRGIKTASGTMGTITEESWLEDVFGTNCTEVTIKRSKPFVGVSFRLEPISAVCVDVTIDGHFSGIVDLDVFAYSASEDQKKSLDGLHLAGLFRQKAGGRRETCHEYSKTAKSRTWPICVIKPFLQQKGRQQQLSDAPKLTQPASELAEETQETLSDEIEYVRLWNTTDYVFDDAGDNFVLALTNVAPDPEETEAENVVLVLGGRSSLASTGQDLAPPAYLNASNVPMGALAMAGDALSGDAGEIVSRLAQGGSPGAFEQGYNLYGLSQAVNLSEDDMGLLEIPVVTSDRQERRGTYQMILRHLPPFGQPGTAEGMIVSGEDNLLAVSRPCRGEEAGWFPVEILETGLEGVRLSFSTPIYGIRLGLNATCGFVENLAAELAIPYGWRVYASLSPSDVVTPGIHAYVERYLANLGDRGLPTARLDPYPGRAPELPAAGGEGSGGGGGSGDAAAAQPGCDCSCDALAGLKGELEAAGDDPSEVMGPAQCLMECQPQLITCAMTEWR